jgi:hypothetical protein
MEQSMNTGMRYGGLALKLTVAAAWRLLMAVTPLNAAEQTYFVQQPSPLETAQRIESLTQGGLYDPNQIAPFDWRRVSQIAAEPRLDSDLDTQPSWRNPSF